MPRTGRSRREIAKIGKPWFIGFRAIGTAHNFLDQEKKAVRFIQVTRSETLSLKLEYFHFFLSMLMKSEASFEIESVELVFLVEVKNLSKFRILDSGVTGQGLLAAFRGWEKGDEWKTVKAVGIDSMTYF